MHYLVQHNEIYEALFINGVAFSLSLHSSDYFIWQRKQNPWLITHFSPRNIHQHDVFIHSSIQEHHLTIYTTNSAFAFIHFFFFWFHCSQENTCKEVVSSWISTHYTERIHKITEDGNPAPRQITCISTVTSTFNLTEKLQHLFPIAFLVELLYDYSRTPDKNKIAKMICQAAIASK